MRTDLIDPDWFAQRELAVNRAIALGRTWLDLEVDLFECSTVQPPQAELCVVRQAHARAKALGLVLPPYPNTTVRFVRAPEDTTISAQTRMHDGVIEMMFLAGQPLDGLHRLALHELAHVHQFAVDARLSPAEAEEDAERFAWNAMQGWK